MQTLIHFVRHGHATHNEAADRLGDVAYYDTDYKDGPLTETGRQQVAAIRDLGVDWVYSSPLRRCIQTATAIAEKAAVRRPLAIDDYLVEVLGGGHICNERPLSVQFRQENVNHAWTQRYADHEVLRQTHRSRETPEQVRERASVFFDELKDRVLGFNQRLRGIAIVTHHDFLYAIFGKRTQNGEVITVPLRKVMEALTQNWPNNYDHHNDPDHVVYSV